MQEEFHQYKNFTPNLGAFAMRIVALKTKKYAFIGLLSMTATSGMFGMITVTSNIKTVVLAAAHTGSAQVSVIDPITRAPIGQETGSTTCTNSEIAFTHEITEKIKFLFDDAVQLLLNFVDDKNTESYGVHVDNFSAKIKELQENIINPIDRQLTSATGTFRIAREVARDLVQDMLANITKVHTVLIKHLPKKNAIDLKADLEPVITRITSTETFTNFNNKLVKLHTALINAGHIKTAEKIANVRTELKKAKAEYDTQKVSARMLGVLRRRLRRK